MKACSPLFVLMSPQDGWTAAVFRELCQWLQPDGRFQDLTHLAVASFNMEGLCFLPVRQASLQNSLFFPPWQFGLSGLREVSRSLKLPLLCRLSSGEEQVEMFVYTALLAWPGSGRAAQSRAPQATDKGVNQKPVVRLGLLLPASSGPATSNTFHRH